LRINNVAPIAEEGIKQIKAFYRIEAHIRGMSGDERISGNIFLGLRMTIHFETITEVGDKIRSGAVSSVELVEKILDRINKHNSKLNAYITVTADLARKQAQQADEELRNGHDRGPLHGIPVAIKDLFQTNGILTTCGSKLFANWIPDEDATVVIKLREAGAVLLGKTGLHELAFGTTSINEFYGAIHNPWKQSNDPGGSSGGSAVAVAAGLAFAALGSDTGASIRQPAHCCGIVGYKPTFGLVSKSGVFPLAWTMDHVGPLARSVEDASIVLSAIAGYDPTDPYSIRSPSNDGFGVDGGSIEGARIGVIRRHFFEGNADVIQVVDIAIETLHALGAEIIELDVPNIGEALAASNITFAESATIHKQNLEERPEAFSDDIRSNLESCAKISTSEYINSQVFRREFTVAMEELMTGCDVLVSPTATATALPISQRPDDGERNSWKNTQLTDFTGQPSISIPCGLTEAQLPVGLMLTGKLHSDRKVLQLAHAVEQATDWQRSPPNF